MGKNLDWQGGLLLLVLLLQFLRHLLLQWLISSEAIFAFKLRLSFFKEAKLAFCFSKLLPSLPQAIANKIKVLVRIVEIFFIIVILILMY